MKITIDPQRLQQQMQFVLEIDKLKGILRQTLLTDASRRENSAEHSWHIAMMAIALEEYAHQPVDLLHVIRLLLVHDLVEIDAGDTFCYDPDGNQSKADREIQAADRIFGLLPPINVSSSAPGGMNTKPKRRSMPNLPKPSTASSPSSIT